MSRTNIDLDDDALARVMARFDLHSKREAVNFALRRTAGPEVTTEELLALRGTGWGGNMDEIKNDPVEEHEISPRARAEIDRLTSQPPG